jgi:hypothetical protein
LADELVMLATALPGTLVLGKWVVERFVGKADALEAKVAGAAEAKLDVVLAKLTALEASLALVSDRQATQSALTGKVEERINGVATTHSARLSHLEEVTARLDERVRIGPRGKAREGQ